MAADGSPFPRGTSLSAAPLLHLTAPRFTHEVGVYGSPLLLDQSRFWILLEDRRDCEPADAASPPPTCPVAHRGAPCARRRGGAWHRAEICGNLWRRRSLPGSAGSAAMKGSNRTVTGRSASPTPGRYSGPRGVPHGGTERLVLSPRENGADASQDLIHGGNP
jgi:hypothetical protein